jgi:uncharacterized protein YbjT (DUF2867 family)
VILVTGGTGFVGGHVVQELRRRDLPVRCLVRDPRKAARLVGWGCELLEGDVTDPTSLQRAAAGAETVIHLVSIRQGRKEEFQRIMVDGTRGLLAAAEEAGVGRFVLMSALGVSEATKDLVPYYRAKWEMEGLTRSSGTPSVIFRPSFIFGRDGGILPTFAKLARLAPVTPIIGSGRQRIQPIWADDLAAHFAEATERDDVTGKLFELGGPDAVSWNEFWERLKRVRRNASERARDGAAARRHPADARPAENARGAGQRRLERRGGPDLRAAAGASRRAAAPSCLTSGPKNWGRRRGPNSGYQRWISRGASCLGPRVLLAGRRVTRRPPRWLGDSP